ncbi:adhesion G protein-coupled receptor E1-like [Sinocyclocheilus grahami]|uniref:adhesion G protein-coupled receptor E1-like n=1 Tax=Sinocyclocheilus grahami TaxID=75366 RepID=UPI0007AD24D3|nr:PREDICTED: adhesion G protein-coupled receptor E1-like [Sinocyclocheilus grahami]
MAFSASEKILESSLSSNPTELASFGNSVLKASEKLMSTLVKPTDTSASVSFTLAAVEGQVFMVGPNVTLNKIPRLDTTNSSVDIDLIGISKNNNERSAAVAFMSYNSMENLLKPDFFNTSNNTIKTMMSTVISATLPKTTNTKLTKPVNFTLKHIRSGLLHFLFLSGFVWMLIEAVLLFICVKNLSQISSKKREVLSSGFLCVIGYLVALVLVAVSVGLVPDGYGSKYCWIKMDKGFIWSFLGPVCVILALNTVLFIKIVTNVNSALKNLNVEVSQMKQNKIMVFKTLAQFVVLGCSWILGFFTNSSKVLEILFLILNSQQGTFIFLIYCVLNNEVRQQYRKLFRCLCCAKQH